MKKVKKKKLLTLFLEGDGKMIKRLLVLMLVFGMASLANASVLDVVLDGEGSLGHAGTSSDPLWEGETIGIKIVLNYNPHPTSPTYDGYMLSTIDVDLHVSGPGSLSHTNLKTNGIIRAASRITQLYPWYNSTITATGVAHLAGSALPPIQGPTDIVWDFLMTCTGIGPVLVDLTRAGVTEYSETGYPINWIDLGASDLGDLSIHQIPEPATIALLGLGGLFLRRRRK